MASEHWDLRASSWIFEEESREDREGKSFWKEEVPSFWENFRANSRPR
jgi:hypothetical protein